MLEFVAARKSSSQLVMACLIPPIYKNLAEHRYFICCIIIGKTVDTFLKNIYCKLGYFRKLLFMLYADNNLKNYFRENFRLKTFSLSFKNNQFEICHFHFI